MVTFIAAYVIVWLGMALYVVRLRSNQRRLERLMCELEARSSWLETDLPSDVGA